MVMRMKRAHETRTTRRRATNVSLRADLVEAARSLGVNLSKEFESRLEALVQERRAELWKKETQGAIAAYTRYFEKHGIWNEDLRGW